MKKNINKEPSLFKKLIDIHYEQAKRRKAIREAERAEWTIEYLSEVIRLAALQLNKGVEIELETKAGHKMTLKSTFNLNNTLSADNDIFNHLDDNAAIERFIRKHSPRS